MCSASWTALESPRPRSRRRRWKSFFIDNPGFVGPPPGNGCDANGNCVLPTSLNNHTGADNAYCVLWDGSQNIQGGTGKINGQYGFRVTVQTNQVGQSGNITITQTRAYPSGATFDANGGIVAAQDLTVNVTDVHVVHSTATTVGSITGVSAEPYNFTYRLSKDALMFIAVQGRSVPPRRSATRRSATWSRACRAPARASSGPRPRCRRSTATPGI